MKYLLCCACVLLLAGMVVLPAAAADTPRPITLTEPAPGELPVDLIEIDDAVKQASPYWVMLVGAAEEQENLLASVDRSLRPDAEKAAMKEELREIWRKYPVLHETVATEDGGSVTRISFDPAAGPDMCLTGRENARLAEISRAMAEAYTTPAPTGTPVTWYEQSVWLIRTDAQGTEVWNRTYRAGDNVDVASVVQAGDGGYLIAANNHRRSGEHDVLLIRTDTDGTELWRKTYGGPDWENVLDMIRTSDGGYVVAGNTGWTPEKDTADAWILRVGSDGGEIWSRTFGEDDEYLVFSTVIQTGDGGFILGGKRTTGATQTDNAWLLKVDRDGEEEWNRCIGGNDAGMVDDLIRTPVDGGYLVAVKNPWRAGSSGAVPLRLIKTDASGEALWTRTLDDTDCSAPTVLLRVPGGGLVGYLSIGGAVLPESDLPKTRLVLIGGGGDTVWSRIPDMPDGLFVVTAAAAPSPGRYAFTGTAYTGGPDDGWLVLADHTGNVTSAISLGGDATDAVSALAPTSDGGYILAGTTRSFGEHGWTVMPGRAPGFGAVAAAVACCFGILLIRRRGAKWR
ncbi:hypothetical protein FGU65_02340 [Methanoculleus sp. FWC-SCC1]|uniref:PQQ-like domain-containing protein n=1 Tax=Methanoculleus frigidifontis TaxID=2584085 RepID=A0ABT8M736_9EURY|nr:hypothetical protein [Methanoculleus sp. FWC-SCC1]MDN7023744.1 hypothetical protein [Methanoculleus sp. FWC-SCC1]